MTTSTQVTDELDNMLEQLLSFQASQLDRPRKATEWLSDAELIDLAEDSADALTRELGIRFANMLALMNNAIAPR